MPNAYQLQHVDFSDEVFVVCPRCAQCALVKGGNVTDQEARALIRCVCTHCGYSQRYNEREADVKISSSRGHVRSYSVTQLGGEVDPYFHHALWFMAPCLEGVVWAYNRRHLDLIERFIGSADRGRNGLPNKNSSIAARLPKWMSAAKNRSQVLKCIRDLKMKCIAVLMLLSLASCNTAVRMVEKEGLDPFSEASRVELLNYNDRMEWWGKLGEPDRPLLEDGKLTIPADSIRSRLELDSTMQAKWQSALYGNDMCEEGLASYCYQPQHMLLFYRADETILGYIEICFECENGDFSDGLRRVSFCGERMELLKPLAAVLQ